MARDSGELDFKNSGKDSPEYRLNTLTGEWEVENIGVPPDVEVEQDPALVRKGRDPQLEKAVEVVLEELKKNRGTGGVCPNCAQTLPFSPL